MTMLQWAAGAGLMGLIATSDFPARAAEGVPPPNSPPTRQEAPVKIDGLSRAEIEKRRIEFQNLTPAEKEARLKERKGRPETRGLTPEERQARRQAMQDRMQLQLAELRKKKANGTISPEETTRLERLERVAKRLAERPPPSVPAKPAPPATPPSPPR